MMTATSWTRRCKTLMTRNLSQVVVLLTPRLRPIMVLVNREVTREDPEQSVLA